MLAAPARASLTIIALNTKNTGEGLAAGASDPNYQLTSFTPVPVLGLPQTFTVPEQAIVVNPNPVWLANGANDKWIGPTLNQSGTGSHGVPPGTYDYQLTFTVPLASTGLITVSGMAAADNAWSIDYGTSKTPSGFGTVLGNNNYTAFVPFNFTFSATPGSTSQLDFIIQNANDTGGTVNDSAFIVNNLLVTVVPEPRESMAIGLVLMLGLVAGHRAYAKWRGANHTLAA